MLHQCYKLPYSPGKSPIRAMEFPYLCRKMGNITLDMRSRIYVRQACLGVCTDSLLESDNAQRRSTSVQEINASNRVWSNSGREGIESHRRRKIGAQRRKTKRWVACKTHVIPQQPVEKNRVTFSVFTRSFLCIT